MTMQMNLTAPPPVLSAADVLAATNQAMATWSYPQVLGTDMRLGLVVEPDATLSASYDGKNVIVFRQDSWCRLSAPSGGAGDEDEDCYPSSALAVTSIFKNMKTGDIVDTDIEFNAIDYSWGDLAGQPSLATSATADYQNALTHELGHVVGLDHNCYSPTDGPTRLFDHTGALEIDCYNNPLLPDTVANATMYPSVILSDTTRRTLSPDDELGVSEIYPHVHDECPSFEDGGCSLAASPAPGRRRWPEALGTLAFLLLLVVLTARQSHRSIRRAGSR